MTTAAAPPPASAEQVRPEIVWPLRAEVLRPGRSPREAEFAGDFEAASGHFAAFAGDRVVGVASVVRQSEPDGPDPTGVWRLRGMAVTPGQRGRGIGALLLDRVRDHVARSGAGVLWCNARVSAEGFYAREGWVPLGDVWDEPDLGPHIRMHDVDRFDAR